MDVIKGPTITLNFERSFDFNKSLIIKMSFWVSKTVKSTEIPLFDAVWIANLVPLKKSSEIVCKFLSIKRDFVCSSESKITSFNWNCLTVRDGHNLKQIYPILKKCFKKNKPTAIIFNTIKGKGIKAFENDPIWHAKKVKNKEIEIGYKALK